MRCQYWLLFLTTWELTVGKSFSLKQIHGLVSIFFDWLIFEILQVDRYYLVSTFLWYKLLRLLWNIHGMEFRVDSPYTVNYKKILRTLNISLKSEHHVAWFCIAKVAACDIRRIYSLIYALNQWKLGTKCESGFARKLFQSRPVRQLISGWKSGRPFHRYGNRFHCCCRKVKAILDIRFSR